MFEIGESSFTTQCFVMEGMDHEVLSCIGLPKLKTLQFSQGSVATCESFTLRDMKSLQKLTFCGDNLTSVKEVTISDMPKLATLWIDGTSIIGNDSEQQKWKPTKPFYYKNKLILSSLALCAWLRVDLTSLTTLFIATKETEEKAKGNSANSVGANSSFSFGNNNGGFGRNNGFGNNQSAGFSFGAKPTTTQYLSMQRIGWMIQENIPLLRTVTVPSTAFADVYNLSGDGRHSCTVLTLRKHAAL